MAYVAIASALTVSCGVEVDQIDRPAREISEAPLLAQPDVTVSVTGIVQDEQRVEIGAVIRNECAPRPIVELTA
jgi:hypothetical protein